MSVDPSPARPRRHTTAILLGCLIGASVFGPAAPAGALPDRTVVPVRYDLTGTGVAGYVTYQTNDVQSHATNVKLPWSMQLTGHMANAASPRSYSLSAQSNGPATLTCTVTVKGKVVSHRTASGDPARVLCDNHGPENNSGL